MAHIVLVEDYLPLARLISLDLSEAGHQVRIFKTGESALGAIATTTPDLLLLDWRLPGLDGIEVCRRLREKGDAYPILFVTAMAGMANAQQGLAAGANDYLVKPFTPQELLRRITRSLQAVRGTDRVIDRTQPRSAPYDAVS